MPGLLNKGTASAEGESNVTPEEQAQYQQFVENGAKMLYSDNVLPKLLESLQGDGSPVEGLANALSTIVMRLEDSAEQSGQPLSGDVMMHGSTELLGLMVEVAEAAGVHKFEDKEEEAALFQAFDQYRVTRQQQGKLPEDQLKADMNQLLQAEQSGNVDDVLPGISEYAKSAPKPEDV